MMMLNNQTGNTSEQSRNAREILKEQKGASIIVAMLLFMMCAMVGSVVLTAASAGTGRIQSMKDETQEQCIAESIARVFSDVYDDFAYHADFKSYSFNENTKKYEYSDTDLTNSTITEITTDMSAGNDFKKTLSYLAAKLFKNQWANISSKELTGYVDLSSPVINAGISKETLEGDLKISDSSDLENAVKKSFPIHFKMELNPDYLLLTTIQTPSMEILIQTNIAAYCVIPDTSGNIEAEINFKTDKSSVTINSYTPATESADQSDAMDDSTGG